MQIKEMKRQKGFEVAPGMMLACLAASALVLFCPGCMRHGISIGNGYRIDDKSGNPMLVPIAVERAGSEQFQTVTVTLPGSSSGARTAAHDCAISGNIFSLGPGSGLDKKSWLVRSPSISGWDKLSQETDVTGQWKLFVRDLARMHDHGCFPSGISTQLVRSAIAERIPLPADLVPMFMYSDQGENFVDLAPGMEIRIQKVLSTGEPVGAGSTTLHLLTVDYDVVSRRGAGIGLRLRRGAEGGQRTSPGSEDRQLLSLDRQFARASVLRLFLQGLSRGESESHAILVGTSDAMQLDALTDVIRQRDPVGCIQSQGVVCTDLPSGSVSLFSIIWINGHRTTCPFGSSLGSLLSFLPQAQQAEALGSVQASRRLSGDRYAGIQITRTEDGVRQLLLLPGDRIDWKE